MAGIWFREHLGSELPASLSSQTGRGQLRSSLAGHAPHTTAPEILAALKQATRAADLPFSIHVAESAAEHDFITSGTGSWADFLAERSIDVSGWNVPARSAVRYLEQLNLLGRRTLAVHLLWTDRRDLECLARTGTEVCLCPRSNRNLHERLPDITAMLDCGIRPCLGTDSLASTETLNVFDEMHYLAKAFPEISPETVLQMATVNGARALGLSDHFGDLTPGKIARFSYIPIRAKNRANVLEALVRQPRKPIWTQGE